MDSCASIRSATRCSNAAGASRSIRQARSSRPGRRHQSVLPTTRTRGRLCKGPLSAARAMRPRGGAQFMDKSTKGPTDPRPQGPAPEFPQEPIEPPGSIDEMTPEADHGETTYRGLNRLTGRRALITGGDSGIGRATAIAYAREGADVLISYLPEEASDAEDTCRYIEQAGRRAVAVPGDIQDEALCDKLVDMAFSELGGLDILVNNAAYQVTHDSIADYTNDEIDRAFRTNVYAMFWLCRAALP